MPPGQSADAIFRWKVPAAAPDYYRVSCELSEGGAVFDRLEGGLVVWNPAVIAAGPRLSLRGNYLRIGDTPRFLFGTDDWSYVFNQDREMPAQWRFDAAQRRDYGVQIYENLQVGMPASAQARADFFRRCDGVVQLAQKYRQVYFAGLLIGANVAADDRELAQQAEWCGAFARRYRDVPGIIYYPNGDLRCEVDARVTPQWNQLLKERYGTDEALRAAWGSHAAAERLGQIPAAEYQGAAWDDVRAYDMNLFRGWLVRRWNSALVRAIRAEDPKALTSCEFYQLPHQGIDIPEGIGDLDLSNIGYFEGPVDDVRRFPSLLKYSDQRARGKSMGPGEYGVKMHPAWGDGNYGAATQRTPEQAAGLFLAVAHYSLGLGASRIHNWCWKDCTHRVFPWGMVYPGDGVGKGILDVHRAQSLLFRQLAPVYREPEVYVLTPDAHRLGGQKLRIVEGILRSMDLALAAHVDNLGVLNERNPGASDAPSGRGASDAPSGSGASDAPSGSGAAIPAVAKAIFYPLPYCPSDAAYQKVLEWVRAGGTLYLSGDISYDEQRRRTRTARLEELCGVRFVGERYPNVDYGGRKPEPLAGTAGWSFSPGHPGLRLELAGAQAIATCPDGSPAAVQHVVGKGRVVFLAEPLELHADRETRAVDAGVYRKVLALAGVAPLPITPDDPFLHVFRVPLAATAPTAAPGASDAPSGSDASPAEADGGSAWVLFNADESRERREVTLPGARPALTLTLAKHRPGLVWLDGKGRLRAVEAAGAVRADGQALLECAGQTITFSADGADLRRSRSVVVLPLAAGPVRLAGAWTKPGAQVGEVREGEWRRCEALPVRQFQGMSEVSIPADAVGSMVLLGEQARLGAAGAAVQALMTQ